MCDKFQEYLYNIQCAFDFVLNSSLIQEDKELFEDTQKEAEDTENYVCDLHDERDYYHFQLTNIRNAVELHKDTELGKILLGILNDKRC